MRWKNVGPARKPTPPKAYRNKDRVIDGAAFAIERAWMPNCCLTCSDWSLALSVAMSASTRLPIPAFSVSTSLEMNCSWIENFFTPEANLANAALTFWIERLIVPTMVEALAAVEIVEVLFTVTMEPDSFRVWPATVIFLVPPAEARAWKLAVVPSTMLVPLHDAF